MNLGREGARKQLQRLRSRGRQTGTKSVLLVLRAVFFACILAGVIGIAAAYGVVKGIIAKSPDMRSIDVSPQGIATTVYNTSGDVIQTLVTSGANRDPVSYEQIPDDLKNAFVAIEDSRFWTHEGVDLKGIFRAAVMGVRSRFRSTQGASTITQQLIKNNVFSGGSESGLGAKVIRKIQEQYLALELEKVMSKEEILENYLNTINLGSNCLGVQTAARRYFDKDVSELTLSECAVIAGITQNPVGYNPITHPENNSEKRSIVLQYMVEQGYITKEQQQEALEDNVYERIQEINNQYHDEDSDPYSYFVDRLITEVQNDLMDKLGYTKEQAYQLLYSGGLEIYTTQDAEMQAIVDEEISDPDNYNEVDNKYSFNYYLAVNRDGEAFYFNEGDVRAEMGQSTFRFDDTDEIDALIKSFKKKVLKNGDRIITEVLTPVLQPQASIVLMDQATGEVKAISGGRGAKKTSLSLNRATSTRRSPGSTFKVLTAFAPAIDACGNTLASVYYDEEYTESTTGKTFRNWWGDDYVGYANIRDGIVYSMNILAVKTLMDTVTPAMGFEYAENFGFNTLYARKEIGGKIYTDISPSLALGGLTDGVTNLQLTAAYATIANGGIYTRPRFYTRILDRNGEVLLENEPETHEVLEESTAFLLTDAMKASLEPSRLFGLHGSTSTAAALEDMPAAGKSGTATGKTDLWFVGYTPYYTMGIWSGFDDQSTMEANESSSYHKIIWKHIMDRVDSVKHLKSREFEVPDDVVEVEICAKSGKLVKKGVCTGDHREGMVYTEYFKKGTEPEEECDTHYCVKVCSSSGMKPNAYCPKTGYRTYLHLPEETTSSTDDSSHTGWKAFKTCTVHKKPEKKAEEKNDKTDQKNKDKLNTGNSETKSETKASSEPVG